MNTQQKLSRSQQKNKFATYYPDEHITEQKEENKQQTLFCPTIEANDKSIHEQLEDLFNSNEEQEITKQQQINKENKKEDKKEKLEHKRVIPQSTVLTKAVCNNDFDVVKYLVESNKRLINIKTKRGTALFQACENGNINIVKYLLNNNADAKIRNMNGLTSLHIAIIKRHTDIAKLLLNTKDSVNNCYIIASMKDNEGWTPLHLAARYGLIDIVKLLIKRHANINTRTTIIKQTPLLIAMQNKRDLTVDYLKKVAKILN